VFAVPCYHIIHSVQRRNGKVKRVSVQCLLAVDVLAADQLLCLLRQMKQAAKRFIYGIGSRERLGNLRPEQDKIRAFLVSRKVLAANALSKVFATILRTEIVVLD